MVLTLMWVLPGSAYVGGYDSSGRSVSFEVDSEAVVLGQPFKIRFGEELTVKREDLKVKFDSLLEDSRCPSDVKCIWAGDANILISVKKARADAAKIELHTSGAFKRSGKYQRYVIKLVTLTPYPRSQDSRKPNDYVATLLVTKE
jgi:hypothetical protein